MCFFGRILGNSLLLQMSPLSSLNAKVKAYLNVIIFRINFAIDNDDVVSHGFTSCL